MNRPFNRIGIGIGIPGGQFVGSGGGGPIGPSNKPVLVITDPNGDINNVVIRDTLLATATTSELDGFPTSSVDIYKDGVFVAHMVRTGPPDTWTYSFQASTSGTYTAIRNTVSGTTTSAGVAITVLGALAPDGLSTTLIAWYESPSSMVNGTTPLASGTTPPTITYSGTLTLAKGVWVKILTTGGARGTAKFRTYLDGLGVTPVEGSDQTTAATYTIPGTSLVVNFPVGTYATDNVYKGVGQPINDKTANAYNLSNTTQPTRPFIITVGQATSAGLPIWRFDGVDDRQIGPSAAATAWCGGTNTPFMVTMLVYINAVPTGGNQACLIAADSSSDANVPLCELSMSASQWQLTRRVNAGTSVQLSSDTLPSTGPHLLVWGFDGTNAFLRDNGVYIIGGDSGTPTAFSLGSATTFNQFSVGCRSISSGVDQFTNFDLVALTIHNSPPATLAEIERYEQYYLGS